MGGLFLFAVAARIPHRPTQITLRTIAVVAGPVFLLALAIFSSWERERTYEMTWLIGRPAAEYDVYGRSTTVQELPKEYLDKLLADDIQHMGIKDYEDFVVIKWDVSAGRECFESFVSSKLARYLERLQTQSVKVRYRVIYDFYQPRSYDIESIGGLGWMSLAGRDSGISIFHIPPESCFPY